jgi:hypothetical protein
MVNSRNKGASFERELSKILFEELGLSFKRDIEQYRESDHGDLICVDMPDFPFSIEAKRYRAGYGIQPAWWSQCCNAAKATGKLPLLVYKYDRLPIRWRFPVAAIVGMDNYLPAGDFNEQYDWRYATECDQVTAMMIIREHLADE